MPMYLITFDLHSSEEDLSFFNLLTTMGRTIQVQKSAVFLSTRLTTSEINTKINYCAESSDEWIITKLDKEFTGSSENVDLLNEFLTENLF